jgi:putative transposase
VKKDMRASASPVALNPTAMADEGSAVAVAFEEVQSSFDKFCLIAGIEALQELLQEEASVVCGDRYQRHDGRRGRRWGQTKSQVGFHGGRVGVDRPRVRSCEGKQELVLPSWAAAQDEDWLSQWAMNQMLINVSTRKFRRSVRLPSGDVGSVPGDGTSKSAVSRKFVALSSAKMREWLTSDLSALDLLAIQIDGLHVSDELILVAAVGIDGRGEKHPLGLVEGATENAATVQALLDNLVERGLDPAGVWLFIIDGAKALSKAIPLARTRRSSAVRCTRRATSLNGCPNRCTPRCAGPCGRPGRWTMPPRPSGWSGTWRGAWRRTGPASRPPSWKGWRRSCAWSGWACPRT